MIQTFIGYTHAVSQHSDDPYIELASEVEEHLVSVNEFIDIMWTVDPSLCAALRTASVTDVLILRGW